MRRNFYIQWYFVPAVCLLLGLLSVVVEIFITIQKGETVLMLRIIPDHLKHWLPWVFFSPLNLLLARRFPFERRRVWKSLFIHSAASLFMAVLCVGIYHLLLNVPGSLLNDGASHFQKSFFFGFLASFRTLLFIG